MIFVLFNFFFRLIYFVIITRIQIIIAQTRDDNKSCPIGISEFPYQNYSLLRELQFFTTNKNWCLLFPKFGWVSRVGDFIKKKKKTRNRKCYRARVKKIGSNPAGLEGTVRHFLIVKKLHKKKKGGAGQKST